MLFHTLEFAILFVCVAPFAYFAGSTLRRSALLVASYAFYGWFSLPLLSLMLFSSALDFTMGHRIHRSQQQAARKRYLMVSLVGNLGLLFVFKYANMFIGSVNSLATLWMDAPPIQHLDIILPLGISFYTFQTLSYTIDIYRRTLEPAESFLDFALFVSFFPQLVAGPIVRAADLLPQLRRGPVFGAESLRGGLGLFVYGLIKKIVIADGFATIANTVYGDTATYTGLYTLLGTYAFAMQIYCDFSGYTDMARGVARLLGYDIGLNFNFPYFSVGIVDFWRRWHISLSTWLRDYVYISLGGNRGTAIRVQSNVLLTMLLGGLWHGANWTFVAWGALHGVWIVAEHALAKRGRAPGDLRNPLLRILASLLTFHLVCVTWVFFRAASISDAWTMISGVLRTTPQVDIDLGMFWILIPFFIVEMLMWRTKIEPWIQSRPFVFTSLIIVGTLITLALGDFRGNDFVYFQF